MNNKLSWLLPRLETKELIISLVPLAGFSDIIKTDHAVHHCPLCLKIKNNPRKLSICRNYKQQKIMAGSEPFFDICPFGVLDYIIPAAAENPPAVLCLQYGGGLLPRPPGTDPHKLFRPPVKYFRNKQLDSYAADANIAAGIISDVIARNLINAPHLEKSPSRQKVHAAKLIIHEYFSSDLSLASLCRQLSSDKSVMSRYFSSEYGCTVHDEINRQRILHAQKLLLQNKNITETAFACGYNDSAYFCRVFKKLTGLTPKEWRRNNRCKSKDNRQLPFA
ncbi:MAG: hypothetical protein A2096_02435 [Spirochaetes bacterium GWF1_41_5]|nr:MAG: hypothetical protein A2096_02435 [Spirochaetes bacterium GWF1_41_5]HBE03027.1 hypothetical protein [Spirochaetia bacterium]